MNECPTCRHIKPDGTYCGSPAQRDRKYCYYHLADRGRRLRRARALRDSQPYHIEIEALDNLYAIRTALTEITRALASGQLESGVAGKMLYAIQQVSAINRRIDKAEAAQLQQTKELGGPQLPSVGNCGEPSQAYPDDTSRVQECPDFEEKFGIAPAADIDAETEVLLRQAAEDERLRRHYSMPKPPPDVRPGSAAFRVYREEAYQVMRLQLDSLQHQLRDYNEQKRQQLENMKKEMQSANPAPEPLANTA